MAPPPMGHLDGFSIDGGRKDEADLRLGNNGFSDKYFLDLRVNLFTEKSIEENPCCIQQIEDRRALGEHAFYDLGVLHFGGGTLFEKTSYKKTMVNAHHFIYGMPVEETLYQKTKDCKPFVNVLREGGVCPGIKVNKSTIKVAGTDKETTIQGYDDLAKRCAKYYEAGARFANWRAKEPSEEGLLQISQDKGNLVGKDIFMMSMGDDFGSEGTFATHTTGGNHQSGADLVTNYKPVVILDTGAEVNVTGDEAIFIPVLFRLEGFDLRAANGNGMSSYICGRLSHERYHMNYVYFSEDVGPRTIISGPKLDLLGYSLKFEGGMCEVRDKGILVGKGCLVEKRKYLMDYLKIPLDRVPVQLPNVEDVPLPDGPVGPLSVFTLLWTR